MSMSSQRPSESTNVLRAWTIDLLSRVHDDDNRNGLWYAVKNGDDVVADMILDYGIDINEYDNYGSIVLFKALELENLEMLKLLLERGSHTADKFGNSAIVEAASNGNKRAVAILLDFGVDVNIMDPDGRTALHKASEAGDVEMIKVLLDKGANADAQDKEDRTALIEAVDAGWEEAVEVLVERGADLRLGDKYGATALHHAAEKGHADIVELLLSWGADVCWKDYDGNNVSEYSNGDEEILDVLEKRRDVSTLKSHWHRHRCL
jgi:ankyrin repeat protein